MGKEEDEPPSISQQLFTLFGTAKKPPAQPTIHDLFTQTNRTIGVGTMSRVRVAEVSSVKGEDGNNVHIALKMMKKTELVRLKQVEHAKNEVQILTRIAHPFITTLYHYYMDERHVGLLQEYVPGGQLYRLIGNNARLPNNSARFYAAQVVMAVQYLHGEHVIYRDLNPENVLLDEQGYVKLVDFGFAKRLNLDDMTAKTWTLCGTPEYLAPEIIQSKGHSKEVDWWALGILIYEMLAGYPPYYDQNQFQIYQKILAGNTTYPQHFEQQSKELISKLLHSDRTRRIGASKNGAEDIKKHKWYRGLNWAALYNRQMEVPTQRPDGSDIVLPLKASITNPNFDNFEEYANSTDDAGPALEDEKEQLNFGNWEKAHHG